MLRKSNWPLIKTTFVVLFFLLMFSHVHSEVTNYCAIPPFLTTAVPPNILLVIDVSGSMDWSAYNPGEDRTGWCTNSNGCGWTYTGNEEGYFIPNKVYRYNDSEGYWEQTDDTDYEECPKAYTDIDYDKRYLGSCLNFFVYVKNRLSQMGHYWWKTCRLRL